MVREKEGFVFHQEAFLDSGVLPSEPSFTFVSPLFPNYSSSIFYFIFYHEALLYSGVLPSAPSFTLPNLLKKMETTKTAQAAWFTMIMLMIVMLILNSYITVMVMAIKMMMIYT